MDVPLSLSTFIFLSPTDTSAIFLETLTGLHYGNRYFYRSVQT